MPEPVRRVRQAVLDRDRYECQFQLTGCTHNANDIYVAKKMSAADRAFGQPDPDLCRAICPPCLATMAAKRTSHARMIGDRLRQNRVIQ
jgi:hypothetical protein